MHPSVRSALLVLLASPLLLAHDGDHHVTSSFSAGLLHPLAGIDHLLAMVAVGLLAVRCAVAGDRHALWRVPATFLGSMLLGGALALSGIAVPGVEWGIALSVLVFGVLIALASAPRAWIACTVVGGFAALHGYAHVSEMSGGIAGYASGMLISTALLHALGIVAGLAVVALRRDGAARIAGGALTLASLALFVGMAAG